MWDDCIIPWQDNSRFMTNSFFSSFFFKYSVIPKVADYFRTNKDRSLILNISLATHAWRCLSVHHITAMYGCHSGYWQWSPLVFVGKKHTMMSTNRWSTETTYFYSKFYVTQGGKLFLEILTTHQSLYVRGEFTVTTEKSSQQYITWLNAYKKKRAANYSSL